MRAHGRAGQMGKRFAILISAAALGVMALGTQTAAAAPEVVKYDTRLTITTERSSWYHGGVRSDRDHNPGYNPANAVRKCMEGRQVVVFKRRPGPDRKVGTARSEFVPRYDQGDWFLRPGQGPWVGQARVYARVKPKVRDRYVCRADRSPTI